MLKYTCLADHTELSFVGAVDLYFHTCVAQQFVTICESKIQWPVFLLLLFFLGFLRGFSGMILCFQVSQLKSQCGYGAQPSITATQFS
jgi:hypothetical protein